MTDLEVLRAFAHRPNATGIQRRSLAGLLGIEDDAEFARQVNCLREAGLLKRWSIGNNFLYALSDKGQKHLEQHNESTTADNPGASPGARASCTEGPEANRANSNAASGASAIPATAPPTRLGGEEGQKSGRRKHGPDVAGATAPEEITVTKDADKDPRKLVAQLVEKSGQWHSSSEVAKACDLSPYQARSALNALAEEGTIQAVGNTSQRRFGKRGLAVLRRQAGVAASAPKKAARKKAKTRNAKRIKIRARRPYSRHVGTITLSARERRRIYDKFDGSNQAALADEFKVPLAAVYAVIAEKRGQAQTPGFRVALTSDDTLLMERVATNERVELQRDEIAVLTAFLRRLDERTSIPS